MAPLTIIINGLSTRDWGAAALFGLAVAVGLTPEMLPAIVNANLARGAMSMMRKKCIVKRLDAIQSMGGMQVLCTDKTGTLTEDRVAVFQCTDAAGAASQSALQYAYLNAKLQTGLRSLLDRAVVDEATTNTSHIDAMERALAEWTKVDEIPFDFARRLLTVVVDQHDHGERLMITKGAMEEVLAACEQTEGDGGEVRSLAHPDRQALLARSARINTDGLRVLGLATKATTKQAGQFSPADETGMTFRGFLAFLDPPKADARDAVQGLLTKGIAVKLASMEPRQFAAACRRGTVFAKLSPFQKVDVVESLQKDAGTSVGFLGDGINDAMALKHADVGVSVDTGTIVAKESADVILLEKSLAVLLDAVVKGRRTAGNTLKYIKMTCAGNFSNTFSVLIAAAWLPYLPMSAVQLLTANIIYDISQISIPWDTMDPEYLEQPRQWIATDIARFMICVGPLSSLTDVAIFSLNQYFFKYQGNEPMDVAQAQTIWYLWAVVMQMAVIPVLRTTKLPFIQSRPARPVAMTLGVMCAIGCSLPYIPAVASVLGMVPPPPSYWPWMALLIVAYMAMAQTIKHFYIRWFHVWI
ncbi:HAD ATPase, P-type, family IC [Allomyces macrogynus ATCC 38327]|uniref:HAD ATPase, P-type, family IC n=1 Tax=Allomyces macrogynus (strain ATCC 38327) TaxID=578462 RepID=A0A0L0T6A4_ALLM3|nr:HAD ATPase, P-type, family IC [Allomyces macrogynus ATCC 38327]|eukprot:KNE70069.1 HAD ATPase, P-type, family IC [Allomyces macrogynus ATCC 38327]